VRVFRSLPNTVGFLLLLFCLPNAAGPTWLAAQENRPRAAAAEQLTSGSKAQEQQPQQPPPNPESQDQQSQAQQPQEQQSQQAQGPQANYDKTIFQNLIPSGQLEFLKQFDGVAARDLAYDNQFRKLMRNIVPACMFHYGHDMPLTEALDIVLNDSHLPVQIQDGRYVVVPGRSGPYLQGRGFIWIDIQDGIGLGGFYFHPTNGEPTPALNVFSKQVQDEPLAMSQLLPAFADDLSQWSADSIIPPVLTRYFITGANRKILLEHDEDYCAAAAGGQPANNCEQMNADAADLDMNAASYLEQTHHVTNATAWMITGREQVAWLRVRDDSCGIGPARLPCYIRITHERTHVIIPGWHPPRHSPAPRVPTVHVPTHK
jgi:uncharacterized protein YecT (DUF1311 family)